MYVMGYPKILKICQFHNSVQEKLLIHINLFITEFVITWFWIQHGSKMDPKMY